MEANIVIKKKILFFIPSLCGRGAEKVLVNLVNNLDHKKYDITVLCLFGDGTNAKNLSSNIRYEFVFRRTFRGNIHLFKLFSPQFLYNKFVKGNYDVMISYLEGPTTRILSGCPDPHVKKFAWVHIEIHKLQQLLGSYRSENELINVYQSYDKIIGVSKNIIDCLDNLNAFDDLKKEIIYNTIESDKIRSMAKEEIDDILYDNSIINICSVGGLVDQKGYDRLLSAINDLLNKDNIVNFHLRIFGEGMLRNQFQKFIDSNKLNSYITLCGYRDNIYKYVAKSDLFICSSYREGFSTAVTESVVVGTPVISTICSGAQEILGSNNEYGLVINNDYQSLYACLKEYLTNDILRKELKEKIKLRSDFFDTKTSISLFESQLGLYD